jgi:ergothioneine biosynthesis protein EgtB
MLADTFRAVRSFTAAIAAPLNEEDSVVQSMPDASPTKWHLAHTTWFFETFVLARASSSYRPFDPRYAYLFNSYYDAVGDRHPRPERGLLTRPTLAEIARYREHVDEAMTTLLSRADSPAHLAFAVTLGLHHEQQHQELLLTDIQHAFSRNPLKPAYRDASRAPGPAAAASPPLAWSDFPEGLYAIGKQADESFAFDNESPRHRVFVESFSLASRLVTNAEYAEFVFDGGYERPDHWLSDGFAALRAQGWKAPLYWDISARDRADRMEAKQAFTLYGLRPIDPYAPVCHVSYYEADAYARWAGARLATETEWEIVAEEVEPSGNFVEQDRLEPAPANEPERPGVPSQLFGDTWEWTQSPYTPYPGFVPFAGDLGEYNGKFMCNQMVLRGGSCLTSRSHIRSSYRNFFPPDARWQCTGIRLTRPR